MARVKKPTEAQRAASKGAFGFEDVTEMQGPGVDIFAELRCPM